MILHSFVECIAALRLVPKCVFSFKKLTVYILQYTVYIIYLHIVIKNTEKCFQNGIDDICLIFPNFQLVDLYIYIYILYIYIIWGCCIELSNCGHGDLIDYTHICDGQDLQTFVLKNLHSAAESPANSIITIYKPL